jgi:hypothetical protein
VAVTVLALIAVGAVNLDHRTLPQRAKAWAAAHPAPASTTLEQLAAYPAEYRVAVFQTLPAADKSRLWRAQLQRVLDTEPGLTAEQHAFVVNTMALATPASFVKDAPHPDVCADIARLFTNNVQRLKVRAIAAGITPAATFGATLVTVSERLRSAVTVRAGSEECNCRGLGWCECGLIGYSCINADCAHVNSCGCIWGDEECSKVCTAAIMMSKPAKQ